MTIHKEKIEVITSIQRRRKWSPVEKKKMVEESYQTGATLSYVARKYDISPSQLFMWRRQMENGALKGVGCEDELIPKSQMKAF